MARLFDSNSKSSSLVSIVLPVYNSGQYLDKCCQSILDQTYSNIEVLLINDGSDDQKTNELIEKYKNLDSRVKVFKQENKGVSAARNKGIRMSSGEFITFVDADDWLDPNAIQIQLDSLLTHNADTTMQGYVMEYLDGDACESPLPFNESIVASNTILEKFLTLYPQDRLTPACWVFMIKATYIKEQNLYFEENIHYAEDLIFACKVVFHTDKVAITHEMPYHYVNFYVNDKRDPQWKKRYESSYTSSMLEMLTKIRPYFGNETGRYNAYRIARYLDCADNEIMSCKPRKDKLQEIAKFRTLIKNNIDKESREYLPSTTRYNVALKVFEFSANAYFVFRSLTESLRSLKSVK